MSTIEAGLLKDLKGLLTTLFSGIDKVLKKLSDHGVVSSGEAKETSTGGTQEPLSFSGDEKTTDAYLVIDPSSSEGKVDISIIGADNKKVLAQRANVDADESAINTAVEQLVLQALKARGKTMAARHMKVKLCKVTGSDAVDIKMSRIFSTYNISAAMDDLESVLEDEEFVESIPEEAQSYLIEDADDELIVTPSEEFDTGCPMVGCLTEAMRAYNNILTIHWNARGDRFFTLHEKLDTYIDVMRDDIDALGELCVELYGSAPNPGALTSQDSLVMFSDQGVDVDEGFDLVKNTLKTYIACLETYYVNFNHDIQSELDNIIRFWNKETDYKLTRQLM